MLERFDSDKDGKLTQAELDASRKALVQKYDTDKDGKLSLSEFEALWLDVRCRRMVRGFQYIDEDGDALITVEKNRQSRPSGSRATSSRCTVR